VRARGESPDLPDSSEPHLSSKRKHNPDERERRGAKAGGGNSRSNKGEQKVLRAVPEPRETGVFWS